MKSLAILKALSDESRLSIFRLLLSRESYSEVIAERLKLAPSTVSFHLKKLSEAGLITSARDQYYTIYKAVPDIANATLADLVIEAGGESPAEEVQEQKYLDKTLKSFFKYGKLVKIPSQKMKRELVLERIAESFDKSKKYSASEATTLLAEIFADPVFLLKELL